jgi:hypothetical protein
MCKSVQQTVQGNETSGLDALVADVLAGKVSIFELLGSAQSGDYWGFVQQMRLFHVLTDDRRILERFHAELRAKMVEAGVDPDNGTIERELARKDGSRRFSKLMEERTQTFKGQPSLLSGATFEICLEQYKALIAHVERRWADACEFYKLGNYPFATFFSILVIEEIGKLSRLAQDLIAYDMPRAGAPNGTVERSHRRKHYAGTTIAWLVRPGGIVLHRNDRPSQGEPENSLCGTVAEVVILGDMAQVTFLVDGSENAPLAFSMPVHVAKRNRVEAGEPANVTLLAGAIHLMPRCRPELALDLRPNSRGDEGPMR